MLRPNVQLSLGMTKAEVRKLLGPPDAEGATSRAYPEPAIWNYGDLELTFWTQKRKWIANEGAILILVRNARGDDKE